MRASRCTRSPGVKKSVKEEEEISWMEEEEGEKQNKKEQRAKFTVRWCLFSLLCLGGAANACADLQ